MKILQVNMHRSKTAHDLMTQMTFEKKVDIWLISEQYKNLETPGWFTDTLGTASIWVPNSRNIHIEKHGRADGFVWIMTNNVLYVSCYFTPNEREKNFRKKLNALEDQMRTFDEHKVIAGDFNAKATDWGMTRTDARGRKILEMAARLGLSVMNIGDTRTFRHRGHRGTIPDITLASDTLTTRVIDWHVLEDFTASDHMYISFTVRKDPSPRWGTKSQRVTHPRWNIRKMNERKLTDHIQKEGELIVKNDYRGNVDQMVKDVMNIVHNACDSSMPKSYGRKDRRPAYWWTAEIADLRKKCLKLRRRSQRMRRRDPSLLSHIEYSRAKKQLRDAIKLSKRQKWRDLVEEVNADPWGNAYKIVKRNLGTQTSVGPMNQEQMNTIVDNLFPSHQICEWNCHQPQTSDVPLFSHEELQAAAKTLQNGKAPGPDGIPAEVLKISIRNYPDVFLKMYNGCLVRGIFPEIWKKQRLVLINKGKGDTSLASSYRPLCMLDSAGKLLEKLIKPRLQEAIKAAGDLSDRQHGFRRGRSCIDAIRQVVSRALLADQTNHKSRNINVLVTLDVKNAFNSARWPEIISALKTRFKIPDYLMTMMMSYLTDRKLIYDTTEGRQIRQITAGVAQGSILGPDLWNAQYNSLLEMEMPDGVELVGYADDVAVLIEARNSNLAQFKLNQTMRRVQTWMSNHGLQLAMAKTEIVMLTKRRIPTMITMAVGEETIATKSAVKYLGILLDRKLSFWPQIKAATTKAERVTAALGRLMRNVGGPSESKRRLLMSTTYNILLYGAEIWAESLKRKMYCKHMTAVQRKGALRVTSAYRTVSEPAILVLAGSPPIHLLAQERRVIYLRGLKTPRSQAAKEARKETLRIWQQTWEQESRGKWTRTLIKNIEPWVNRKHGELNYYLTQFLTGHGCFNEYLKKMGIRQFESCQYCTSVNEDVYHTFFVCPRWAIERTQLRQRLDTPSLAPENIIEIMLSTEKHWNEVSTFSRIVLQTKRREQIEDPK